MSQNYEQIRANLEGKLSNIIGSSGVKLVSPKAVADISDNVYVASARAISVAEAFITAVTVEYVSLEEKEAVIESVILSLALDADFAFIRSEKQMAEGGRRVNDRSTQALKNVENRLLEIFPKSESKRKVAGILLKTMASKKISAHNVLVQYTPMLLVNPPFLQAPNAVGSWSFISKILPVVEALPFHFHPSFSHPVLCDGAFHTFAFERCKRVPEETVPLFCHYMNLLYWLVQNQDASESKKLLTFFTKMPAVIKAIGGSKKIKNFYKKDENRVSSFDYEKILPDRWGSSFESMWLASQVNNKDGAEQTKIDIKSIRDVLDSMIEVIRNASGTERRLDYYYSVQNGSIALICSNKPYTNGDNGDFLAETAQTIVVTKMYRKAHFRGSFVIPQYNYRLIDENDVEAIDQIASRITEKFLTDNPTITKTELDEKFLTVFSAELDRASEAERAKFEVERQLNEKKKREKANN